MRTFGQKKRAGIEKELRNPRQPTEKVTNQNQTQERFTTQRGQQHLGTSSQNFLRTPGKESLRVGRLTQEGYQKSPDIRERVVEKGDKRIYEGYICNICANSHLHNHRCQARNELKRRDQTLEQLMILRDKNLVEEDRARQRAKKEGLKKDRDYDLRRAAFRKGEEERRKATENQNERGKFSTANAEHNRRAANALNQEKGALHNYRDDLVNQIRDNELRKNQMTAQELEEYRRAQGLPLGQYNPNYKDELKRTLEQQMTEKKRKNEEEKLRSKQVELERLQKIREKLSNRPDENLIQREANKEFATNLKDQIEQNRLNKERQKQIDDDEYRRANGLPLGKYNPDYREELKNSLLGQMAAGKLAKNNEKNRRLNEEKAALEKINARNALSRLNEAEENAGLRSLMNHTVTEEYQRFMQSKEAKNREEKELNRQFVESMAERDRRLLDEEKRKRKDQQSELKGALTYQIQDKRNRALNEKLNEPVPVRTAPPSNEDELRAQAEEKRMLREHYAQTLEEKQAAEKRRKREEEDFMNGLVDKDRRAIQAEREKNWNQKSNLKRTLEQQMNERAQKRKIEEIERKKPMYKKSATRTIREFIKCGNCERLLSK